MEIKKKTLDELQEYQHPVVWLIICSEVYLSIIIRVEWSLLN